MESARHAYLDGFASAPLRREVEELTPAELLKSLDPHQEADHALTPWRRDHHAAVRAALGL